MGWWWVGGCLLSTYFTHRGVLPPFVMGRKGGLWGEDLVSDPLAPCYHMKTHACTLMLIVIACASDRLDWFSLRGATT